MGKMTVDFAVKVHSRIKAHLVVRFGDQMLRAQLMSNMQVSGSDVGDITNGVCRCVVPPHELESSLICAQCQNECRVVR